MTLTDFQKLNQPSISRTNSIWTWCTILYIVGFRLLFFKDFCIYVYEIYWPTFSLFFLSLFLLSILSWLRFDSFFFFKKLVPLFEVIKVMCIKLFTIFPYYLSTDCRICNNILIFSDLCNSLFIFVLLVYYQFY